MKRKLIKGIRITRIIALTMIAAPEPVSTVLGICILFGLMGPSLVLRHQEVRRKAYLRHIIKEYTQTYRPFGFGIGYKPTTSANLPYRFGKPIYNKIVKSSNQDESPWFQNITSEHTPIFHAFNRDIILKRFISDNPQYHFEGRQNHQSAEKERLPVYHSFYRTSSMQSSDKGGSRYGFVGYWGKQSFVEIKPDRKIQKAQAILD